MNRPGWIREEAEALELVARCSDAAETLLKLLELFKAVPPMHRKLVKLSLLIIDVKEAAQAYRDTAGAQINERRQAAEAARQEDDRCDTP